MKNENYFTIQGWMINELKLRGNDLILYAIIYGFSQDGKSEFKGSLTYLQEVLTVTRPTVINSIHKLIKLKLIRKKQITRNKVTYNTYTSIPIENPTDMGSKKTLLGGSKKTLPNSNRKEDNNNKKENKKRKSSKKFQRTKKPPEYLKYFDFDFKNDKKFQALFTDYIQLRKEKRNAATPIVLKTLNSEFTEWGLNRSCESIQNTLKNGWLGIFEINQKHRYKPTKKNSLGSAQYSDTVPEFSTGIKQSEL